MTSSKDRSAKLGLRCCYFLSNIHRKHDELVKTTFCFLKMIMAEVILKTLPAKKKKKDFLLNAPSLAMHLALNYAEILAFPNVPYRGTGVSSNLQINL